MKYILVLTALFALSACQYDGPTAVGNSGIEYRVECIDGIEHWLRNRGRTSLLAVRVNPETLTFVRCERN
jgi:hypothetical protein